MDAKRKPMGCPALLPLKAIDKAKEQIYDQAIIDGLEHAAECIQHTAALLRYIKARVPSYEPELHKLITQQLIKGCDL